MRLSTHYVSTFLVLLISLSAIILAAPAAVTGIGSLTGETSSDTTSGLTNTHNDLHGINVRSSLNITTVQGNPTDGETLRPEPKVAFLSCKPRRDVPQMCTMSFVQKSSDTSAVLIAYDHNCNRIGNWAIHRQEMEYMVGDEKHGHDFITPNLKWHILVYMPSDVGPNPHLFVRDLEPLVQRQVVRAVS